MLLSMGLEVPVLLLLAWRWRDASLLRVLGVGVLATALTHPFVWHGVPALSAWIRAWPVRAGIAEVSAWLAEAALFAALLRWSPPRALLASGLANGWSFGIGLLWFLVLLPVWSTSCPAPLHSDPARARRLVALADAAVREPVCFGAVSEGGVRDAEGRLRLDADRTDRWLAARVLHLVHHTSAPPRGAGCEAALRRREAEGWVLELGGRDRLGVPDPTCPIERALGLEPSVDEVEGWIASSPHPRAAALRASHAARCDR